MKGELGHAIIDSINAKNFAALSGTCFAGWSRTIWLQYDAAWGKAAGFGTRLPALVYGRLG
jgi:hypothetical protein